MKIFRSVDLAWQFRLAVVALALALLAPGSAYAAANKEHAQLMAEIRMLQEQQQQLQAMLGNLGDAMKALSAKLDDQAGATRKAMADQALTLNGIGDTVRVLREKVDDTTVRVSSVSQEIAALRQALAAAQAAAPPPAIAPSATGGEPGAQPTTPSTPVPSASAPPSVSVGQSPQQAFDSAYDDYTASRYDLAIEGFNSFIRAFPRHPRAAEAQFYIGQSYFNEGKYGDARQALQQVIDTYPQSPSAPEAYFKLGQTYERMNQIDLAKRAYETIVKNYPDTTMSVILAKQALERLNRK
ncbi:MAG TPA: tol-pal system protein YbgF [Vicinamibacterales bacterium]|jgi:tol-pal system protein YbgF|nr:tol-pal system protein YbgF [Vicinamibacterales bacterium]